MPEESYRAPKRFVANQKTDLLEGAAVQTKFQGFMEDRGMSVLAREIEQDGFMPLADQRQGFVGLKETYESNDGRNVQFELDAKQFEKPGTMEKASLVTVTIASGDNKRSYKFALIAPDGKFDDTAVEFTVDSMNETVRASSWWSDFWTCLRNKCGPACIAAIPACGLNYSCLIIACVGCGTKCAACATCNCRWWCKWAAGCC